MLSNFSPNSWWDKSPYKLFIGSKVQWSVFDFVFLIKWSPLSSCSPTKTFFKTSFPKQSVWNYFGNVMHWFPSKFSSEIAATSWQHERSISLISFLRHLQIHQSLHPILFIPALLGETFSSSLLSSSFESLSLLLDSLASFSGS